LSASTAARTLSSPAIEPRTKVARERPARIGDERVAAVVHRLLEHVEPAAARARAGDGVERLAQGHDRVEGAAQPLVEAAPRPPGVAALGAQLPHVRGDRHLLQAEARQALEVGQLAVEAREQRRLRVGLRRREERQAPRRVDLGARRLVVVDVGHHLGVAGGEVVELRRRLGRGGVAEVVVEDVVVGVDVDGGAQDVALEGVEPRQAVAGGERLRFGQRLAAAAAELVFDAILLRGDEGVDGRLARALKRALDAADAARHLERRLARVVTLDRLGRAPQPLARALEHVEVVAVAQARLAQLLQRVEHLLEALHHRLAVDAAAAVLQREEQVFHHVAADARGHVRGRAARCGAHDDGRLSHRACGPRCPRAPPRRARRPRTSASRARARRARSRALPTSARSR
jgi:hypothetical protein